MIQRKPILVTGAHRSGSTWIGRMIALSPSVGYIQEPFNLEHRPGICSVKFNYWFPYISDKNESYFYEKIKKTICFSYSLNEEIKAIKSLVDVLRLLRDYSNFHKYRFSKVRPLLKDPLAIFSAEWLASKFDMDVVVLIRHPAAFASSIKRKNWTFPFSHLLKQPLLIEDHLYPFEAEIREYAEEERDIIDQASLLWKLIHYMIAKYQSNHKDWLFMKHEDISINPLSSFQTIYKYLNLEFSEPVRKVITEYSSSENPIEASKNESLLFLVSRQHLKRDSRSNLSNWKSRLNVADINRIRSNTEAIANIFYSDKDW